MSDSVRPPIPNSYWIPGTTLCAGEYPGHYTPEGAVEKIGKMLDAGIEVFIDLTRDDDPLDPYADVLAQEAEKRGMTVLHVPMPIEDMGVTTAEHMAEILVVIEEHLANGKKVYVHCWGGIGRTGTTVGCFLVNRGLAGHAALEEVLRLYQTMSAEKIAFHPHSPQTRAQREMVRSWGKR